MSREYVEVERINEKSFRQKASGEITYESSVHFELSKALIKGFFKR